MSQEADSGVFETRRVLSCSLGSLFAAFEQPATLARWWGPRGFTNTFETFEFREGGSWRFVMHGPDGANYANQSTFIEVHAPTKLVIQHVSQPRFVLTVRLTERTAGTEILWHQVFEDKQLAARLRHHVEPANEQNLDRLETLLATSGSVISY